MENNSGIVVYTDGGCRGNPGCGGWGCVIIDGEKEYKFSGGEKLTTNNRMELMAAISALNSIAENTLWKNQHISVYSDSQYVKNGITSWIQNWKKNGWKTSAKKWMSLFSLKKPISVRWFSMYGRRRIHAPSAPKCAAAPSMIWRSETAIGRWHWGIIGRIMWKPF